MFLATVISSCKSEISCYRKGDITISRYSKLGIRNREVLLVNYVDENGSNYTEKVLVKYVGWNSAVDADIFFYDDHIDIISRLGSFIDDSNSDLVKVRHDLINGPKNQSGTYLNYAEGRDSIKMIFMTSVSEEQKSNMDTYISSEYY